jgi:hypothetical protein
MTPSPHRIAEDGIVCWRSLGTAAIGILLASVAVGPLRAHAVNLYLCHLMKEHGRRNLRDCFGGCGRYETEKGKRIFAL